MQAVSNTGCSASNIAGLQSEANSRLGEDSWSTRLQAYPGYDVATAPVQYRYRMLNRFPHDRNAFTQGLVFLGGDLYESTGLFGESTLREVDLYTGKVRRLTRLDDHVFGEGLAVLDNRFVQLSWRSGVAFVYDPDNFRQTAQFAYHGEGWGSTSADGKLIVSDGTAVLVWMDPEQHRITKTLYVREGDEPVSGLNELEYVDGRILANVWPSDCIAEIDPYSGQITGWIDLTGLYPHKKRPHSTAVLNGIAYDREQKRLFVTGKLWPYIYEIERIATDTEQHTVSR